VLPAIFSRGTDILALEAVLAMALFMQGSSDSRTTSLLISEAAKLSLTLGFHRSSFYTNMNPNTAERHKRAFWIAYILDKDMSIKTGMPSTYNDDDISLGYTTSDSLGCPGKVVVSEVCVEATIFRLRAQLAVIESKIQNQLYSEKSTKCSATQLLQAVVELEYRLEDWKGHVPLNIQPGNIDWSTVIPPREPIILLHLVYYRAMSAVHSFAAHLMPANDLDCLSQSISSEIIHTSMAQESVRLLQFLPPQAPGCLWYVYKPSVWNKAKYSDSQADLVLSSVCVYCPSSNFTQTPHRCASTIPLETHW
jgi:Fungal specific transcription factor domain.